MGQFFKFVNRDTKVISTVPVQHYQGADYVVNLHINKDKRAKEIFSQIAKDNNWDSSYVMAVGDYGNLVWLNYGEFFTSHIDDLGTDKSFYESVWEK